MAFKFSVLSLERTQDREQETKEETKTMVKKTTSKQKAHQKKFGKAVQKCHRTTNGKKSFGSCMKKELKK